MHIGCGNRPDYETKRKTYEDSDDGCIIESSNDKDISESTTLCKTCKSNPTPENVEEELITNTECNIDRDPRFVNGKVRAYGIIHTMYNCGIVIDFLEINLSEQVYITLSHWTNMLRKINDLTTILTIFI